MRKSQFKGRSRVVTDAGQGCFGNVTLLSRKLSRTESLVVQTQKRGRKERKESSLIGGGKKRARHEEAVRAD